MRHAVTSQAGTVTVAVQLPDRVLQILGPTPKAVAENLRMLAMIEMFRRGEVSSGWAAEQLGMTKSDFIDVLARHEVPFLDLSPEELRRDLGALRRYRSRQQPSSSPTAAP